MTNRTTRTHKASGWARTNLQDGTMRWVVTPTDGSGDRIVKFLSAGTWQKDPGDDRANADTDRWILLDGPALPDWAAAWLTFAVTKQSERGREALRAAIDDADNAPFRNEGW